MTQANEAQVLMQHNLLRLLGDGTEKARAAGAAWPRVARASWIDICFSGWPALLLPEAAGGWGCTADDMVALLDGAAAALPHEPLAPALAVAPLLAKCGTPAADALLRQVLSGEILALIAGTDPFPVAGDPRFVLFEANWADAILCAQGEGEGFRLFQVQSADVDGQWPLRQTIDGGAQRVFAAAPGAWRTLGTGAGVERAYATASSRLRLAAAASLGGIARRALDVTVDYLKVREQFGQPIGGFQALQHRAASLHVAVNAARALTWEAALSEGSAQEHVACAMAKAKASRVAQDVLKDCVQMHGAIGFSDEYVLALYFRKAMVLASAYGTADECLRDIARPRQDASASGAGPRVLTA